MNKRAWSQFLVYINSTLQKFIIYSSSVQKIQAQGMIELFFNFQQGPIKTKEI